MLGIAGEDTDVIVELALDENLRYVACAGAWNRLAPFVGFSKTTAMQFFDRDDDVRSGTEQDNP